MVTTSTRASNAGTRVPGTPPSPAAAAPAATGSAGLVLTCHLAASGDVDLPTVETLDEQVTALLAAGMRHLVLDVSAVGHCDPRLLDLLARTQRQLSVRRGMVSLTGAPPDLLAGLNNPS